MGELPGLAEVVSVRGHRIRLTLRHYHGMVDLQSGSSAGQRSTSVDTISIDKRLIPFLLQLPARQVWMDYDAEGDVLYLSFAMPQQATDSVMGEDGNVYHYRGEQLVGVTILHASKRDQVTEK